MITLKNITKKFDSRAIAGLHDLSLEIKSGEVVAIMGPNGSGKSTLLNIIRGSLKPDSGSLVVPQEVRFFQDLEQGNTKNVQKYLISRITHDIDDEKKIQLARDLADIFEFTFQLRQSLAELSAGQRQKVLLAAELINRPGILLLDEPFTHLDPHTRTDILIALFNYVRHQEISILWVTHDLTEAMRFSDRVGIMNFGKLEQFATPEVLCTNPRSLFVADFLGYENLLIIKKQGDEWLTPWGNIHHHLDKEEAILIIPPEAIILSENGMEVEVLEQFLTGNARQVSVQFQNTQLMLRLNPSLKYQRSSRFKSQSKIASSFLCNNSLRLISFCSFPRLRRTDFSSFSLLPIMRRE